MSKNPVQALLLSPKLSMQALLEVIESGASETAILTVKSANRLLTLIKEDIDTTQDATKAARILHAFKENKGAIKQLTEVRSHLPFIIDKILSVAVTGCPNAEAMLTVVYDFLLENVPLKSALCMSVHGYIIGVLDRNELPPNVLVQALEILVMTVTHHPDNRATFVRYMKHSSIGNIFKLVYTTGEPMAQLYGAEFLWRVGVSMKISEAERSSLFGNHVKALYSISPAKFREGIINFVAEINEERDDQNAIKFSYITNVLVGKNEYNDDGRCIILVGVDKIALWLGQTLISLSRNDIFGINSTHERFAIKLAQEFDTLVDNFSSSTDKIIQFTVRDENKLQVLQQRFPFGNFSMPECKKQIPATPKIKKKEQQDLPKRASTPKIKKAPNPPSILLKKKEKVKPPPPPPPPEFESDDDNYESFNLEESEDLPNFQQPYSSSSSSSPSASKRKYNRTSLQTAPPPPENNK